MHPKTDFLKDYKFQFKPMSRSPLSGSATDGFSHRIAVALEGVKLIIVSVLALEC